MMTKFYVMCVLLACVSCATTSTRPNTIPSFSGATSDGKTLQVEGARISKPTLIFFWATWCVYCRQEIPNIMKFHAEHGSEVDIIGINLDEDFEVAKRYIKKTNIEFVNVSDERGRIANKFYIVRTPTLLAINKEGVLVKLAASMGDLTETLLAAR